MQKAAKGAGVVSVSLIWSGWRGHSYVQVSGAPSGLLPPIFGPLRDATGLVWDTGSVRTARARALAIEAVRLLEAAGLVVETFENTYQRPGLRRVTWG